MTLLMDVEFAPIKGDESPLTDKQIAELAGDVPGWSVVDEKGVKRLERVFKFQNFADALAFTQRVGDLAESQDHHPLIITEWGRVTVRWWTHKIKGLHRNDFIMAAKVNALPG